LVDISASKKCLCSSVVDLVLKIFLYNAFIAKLVLAPVPISIELAIAIKLIEFGTNLLI